MVDKNAQDQADYAAYVKDQKDKADYSAYVASQQPKDGDPSFLNDPGLKDDASDALKGYSSGAAFGMAPIMGGAIQAGLDMGQKGLNKLGLASPSPSQVGAKLKASGATGDIGATTSTDMLHQGEDETRDDFAAAQNRSPGLYGASNLLGGTVTGLGAAKALGLGAGTANVAKTGVVNALKNAGMTAGVTGAIGAGTQLANGQNNLIGPSANVPGALQDAGKAGLVSGALGGGLSLGASALGGLANAVGNTAPAQALKQTLGGTKLLGANAMEDATNALTDATKSANQGVENIRKNTLSANYDKIKNSPQTADMSDVLPEIQKNIAGIKSTLPGAQDEKSALMGLVQPDAPFTPIEPNIITKPAVAGTMEQLTQQGELAVQNEKALGNDASYSIKPGKTSDGKDTLSLVINKQGAASGFDASGNPTATAQTKLDAPSQPETQVQDGFNPSGDVVNNPTPINPIMSGKDALQLRTQLNDIANNQKLDPEVRKVAKDSYLKVNQAFRDKLSGLGDNDSLYAALKTAQDVFDSVGGPDADNSARGLAKNFQSAEANTLNGQLAKQKLTQATNRIGQVDPALANQINTDIPQKLDQFNLTSAANSPFGIKKTISGTIHNNLTRGAALLGEGISDVGDATGINSSNVPQGVKDFAAPASDIINNIPKYVPLMDQLKPPSNSNDNNGNATNSFVPNIPNKSTASNVYNQNNQKYLDYGSKLAVNPSTAHLGMALNNAIHSNNSLAKTQALFVIQQNPQARKIIDDQEDS